MRVIHVVGLIAEAGGIESRVTTLALELKRQKHDIMVYSGSPFRANNQYVRQLWATGISVIAPPRWVAKLGYLSDKTRASIAENLPLLMFPVILVLALIDAATQRRSFRRSVQGVFGRLRGIVGDYLERLPKLLYLPLNSHLSSFLPDLVHIHGHTCGKFPPHALEWAAEKQLPAIYEEHGVWATEPNLPKKSIPSSLHLAHATIAISQAASRELKIYCNCQQQPVVIPPIVEIPNTRAEYPPASAGKFNLVCVGMFRPEKGHESLLRALAKVKQKIPSVQLHLVGDGILRSHLVELTYELGLAKSVNFPGALSQDEVTNIVAQADLYIQPSLGESLGIAIIEAMACEKPIIASAVGGIPELVEVGDNGLLVPPGDVDALAEAICELLDDPKRRQVMGKSSRKRYEIGGYTAEEVGKAVFELYCQVTQNTPEPQINTYPIFSVGDQ